MTEDYLPHTDDYDVFDENGHCIGSIEMVVDASCEDMPTELEINGVTYSPNF